MTLCGIQLATGALRVPQQEDVATKAWDDKQSTHAAKLLRIALYNAMSPTDKAEKESASDARRDTRQVVYGTSGVKEQKCRKRIKAKVDANTQRKTKNKMQSDVAKIAFSTAQGLPSRGETYTSPKGSEYPILVCVIFVCEL